MNTTQKLAAYRTAQHAYREAVSINRSRRMARLTLVAQPAKPEPIKIPVVYSQDGTYEGVLAYPDECPEGMVIRWERRQ